MIGIYKITNKLSGKTYIGQSNDIERRFKEHKCKKDIPVEIAIQKYGVENFIFEVLEECSIDELDEKEKYYINLYNTYRGNGYNCNEGGGCSNCENNGRTKLTNEDVYDIREAYNKHLRRKDVYENYKDRIAFGAFARIWDGSTWKGIHSDVYTPENKEYYKHQATNGESSDKAIFTNEEVIAMRTRYVNETADKIYEDYKDRCALQTLKAILWGNAYKDLPLYKKREKRWINI